MKIFRPFLFIGIWLLLLPFLGFPGSWKNFLTILTGALICYISISRRNRIYDKVYENQKSDKISAFSESSVFNNYDGKA